MTERSEYAGRTGVETWSVRRISWGAIIAGALMALVVSLTLMLLGMAIGLGMVDPQTDPGDLRAIGIGTGIWWVISGLAGLFVGGWFAGKFAGWPLRIDGVLHGLVTWALTTVLSIYLMSTVLGAVVGGAFGVLQSGMQALGPAAAEVAPDVVLQLTNGMQEVRQDAQAMLRQRGRPEITQDPQTLSRAEEDLVSNIQRTLAVNGPPSPTARQQLITMVTNMTDLPQQQAGATVDRWAQIIQQAGTGPRMPEGVGRQAEEAARRGARGVSQASIWSFLALLLGAVAAALGGAAGVPAENAPRRR